MRLLLDTQILIWALSDPDKLPGRIVSRLMSDTDEKVFSAASTWEVAIKFSLRRPDVTVHPSDLVAFAFQAGLHEFPVTSTAAARVTDLPMHHRDPFDRLLIAQALDAGATLLTADRTLVASGPSILLAN